MLMKKKQRKNIGNFDIKPAPIEKTYIEIIGEREAVLTGKSEIIELGETVLKIKCNEHRIIFEGESLRIVNYAYDGISIRGRLKKIEFVGG